MSLNGRQIITMIPISSLQKYFLTIPKDFDLVVNNDHFRCNKQILKAYSELINSKISENPELNQYSLKLNVPVTAVQTILDLIHVKSFHPSEKIIFECYTVAATLGIECARIRLTSQIFSLLNESNFANKLKDIILNPNYYVPFINFLEANGEYAKAFLEKTLISEFSIEESTYFVSSITKGSNKLFPNEADKLKFICKFLSDIKDFDKPNILSNLDTSLLDQEAILSLLKQSREVQYSLKLFPFLLRLMEIRKEKLVTKQQYQDSYDEINQAIEQYQLLISNSEYFDANKKKQIEETENLLKKLKIFALNSADRLEFFSAVIYMLVVVDKEVLELIENVEHIYQRSLEMYKLQYDFKELRTGKVIYPNGTNEMFDIASKFKECALQFNELVKEFHPDETTVKNISNQLMVFAATLRQIAQ